jgi:hypothetical protein
MKGSSNLANLRAVGLNVYGSGCDRDGLWCGLDFPEPINSRRVPDSAQLTQSAAAEGRLLAIY